MFTKKNLFGKTLAAAALFAVTGAANAGLIIEIDFDLSTAAPDAVFTDALLPGFAGTAPFYIDPASGSVIQVFAASGAPDEGRLTDTSVQADVADGVEATIRIFDDSFLLGDITAPVFSLVTPTEVGPADTRVVTSIDGTVIMDTGTLVPGALSGSVVATLAEPTTIEHLITISNSSGRASITSFDTTTRVPEPSMIALLGLGFLGFAATRRRRLRS